MSAFDNPVFDAVAERLEVEKQKKAYEHSNILNDPQKIDTIKGLKPHLCSNAVPRAHKGMPKVSSCKTCESQCGYGRRLIELAAAINQKTQKTKGDNLKDASQAPQDPDQNEGRLCLLLTKNQCVGVADFIEANLIDVIRNKSNIDNVNRIADIIGAMQAMRAATGTEEEA